VRIAEIYASLQGEGLLTGTPSVFVRTSGCNLRCWFCDTPYTSWDPEGEDWSVEEIVAEVQRLPHVGCITEAQCTRSESHAEKVHFMHPTNSTVRHAVLTGGEPMLFAEMIPLCDRLRAAGLHITIETAGTLFLPVACDLMSISPKLASSTPSVERGSKWAARHEQTRHQPEVIRRLTGEYDYQLKFVIDTPEDCEEVHAWLAEFPHVRRDRVLLMPQGTDAAHLTSIAEWLAPYCREHGFVFCPRKHIEWYGAKRGT
jgi:7-carboxy-7-deazaguanine synthase